ncbi:MAG: hypothetical protein JW797_04440 [Bradymonadales bacterium]|nr:hypothetical protein [Bradymonadales bacterium]
MTTQITEMMLISTRKFVTNQYGPEPWGAVLEHLAPSHRAVLDRELSPKQRFDFPLAADLLKTLAEQLGKGGTGDEVMHKLGRHNAEDDLNVTEKLLMKILTVKIVLRIASILWTARVKNGGKMRIIDRGRKAVSCWIENPPDVSVYWWKYLAGWFQRTIELAGGREVASAWVGGAEERSGETARFEVSWS